MKKLRELTVEELFESFVLIKNADVRVAKNGKKFILGLTHEKVEYTNTRTNRVITSA